MPELETDLSLEEAFAVLEPFYLEIRKSFVDSGYDRVKRTRLYVAPGIHDSPRHFGACRDDGCAIIVAPELAELPYPFVIGILGHELGHATDFLYPGEFTLDKDRRSSRRDMENVGDTQRARWMVTWEKRDADVVEYTADSIAEQVWGAPIGYAGPCLLQNFRVGNARPEGLR